MKKPSLAAQGVNYVRERREWKAAGKPMRPAKLIKYIYENICKPCEHFDGEQSRCNVCGCFIKMEGEAWNKLAWATTRCPLVPPKWKNISQDDRPALKGPPKPKKNPPATKNKRQGDEECKGCGKKP